MSNPARRSAGSPPRLIERWLGAMLTGPAGRELLEDLAEEYRQRAAMSRPLADLWYASLPLRPEVRQLARELVEVAASRVGQGRSPAPQPISTLAGFLRDLRTAGRRLVKMPGYAVVTVVTLGVGIGATVAIQSVVTGVVLRPLPYPEPGRLVWLSHVGRGSGQSALGQSFGTYLQYRDQSQTLAEIAIYQTASATLTGEPGPERVEWTAVTYTFFELLRIPALEGRVFRAEEDAPNGPRVAVISHGLWTRRFGADPGIVGRTIPINGRDWEVIGVMPPAFQLPTPEIDVWIPQQIDFAAAGFGGFYLSGIGRLAPGVSIPSATSDLGVVLRRLGERFPEVKGLLDEAGLRPVVTPLQSHLLGGMERTLWVVLAGVYLVLLIACANVANLLLVRAESRSREVSVRRALGAGSRHLISGALAESAWLAGLGSVIGWTLARVGVGVLGRLASQYIPRFDQVTIDGASLAVSAGMALVTSTLAVAVPLVRSRGSLAVEQGRRVTADRGRERVRQMLVVTQVALALLLLILAGLLARSYRRLQGIEPGFAAEGVLTFELQLPGLRYPDRLAAAEAIERFRQRLLAVPGVTAAGTIACLPLSPCSWENRNGVAREDAPIEADRLPPSVWVNTVSPGYFDAMGIPLRAGRSLAADDYRDSTGAVVIDEVVAARFWPAGDAIGKRIYPSVPANPDGWYRVVGIVGAVRNRDLMATPEGMIYLPQVGTDGQQWWTTHQTTMTVRTDLTAPLGLLAAVRAAIAETDADLALARVRPMSDVLDQATARSRLAMMLLGTAGSMALLLAVVGVYAVMGYLVGSRRREMGLRLALGATRGEVARMVLGQAGWMGGVGIAIGLVIAVGATRVIRSLLFEVGPSDPLTLASVPMLLTLALLGAAYLPARRAARLDPVDTLRDD